MREKNANKILMSHTMNITHGKNLCKKSWVSFQEKLGDYGI